jgi:hypothetical protein
MSTAGQEIAIRQISFLGGGRILRPPRWKCWRSARGTWPLARLTVRDDGIDLRVAWARVWFPRENVLRLVVRERPFGCSIQIVPVAEAEGWFFFRALNSIPVLPVLFALRYPVADGSVPPS